MSHDEKKMGFVGRLARVRSWKMSKEILAKISLLNSMKTKLLAIVGSQRKNGNSYSLAKTVLESFDADHDIIQLADKKIEFCNLCEECIDKDCVLEDDFNEILAEMKKADGIILAVPKYLTAPSKFLAFLERLATIVHIRRHMGYGGPPKNPDYRLFSEQKPFCVFALSGTGKFNKRDLRNFTDYTESLGLTLVSHDHPPFIAVNVKAGDDKGEVLKNKAAIERCRKLAQKVIMSTKKN
jgi:multimeric flavodoxin WrbA